MKPTEMQRVWDPMVRIGHWSLGLLFVMAYITEDHLLLLHSYSGYAIMVYLVARIVWGVVGTHHALFVDFAYSPTQIGHYLSDVVRFRAHRYIGHNPAGGAMVLALLLSLIITTVSGLLTYGVVEGSGPLAPWLTGMSYLVGEITEELHEWFANLTLLLVFLHLAGVLLASLQHRENLIASMWHGNKPIHPTHKTNGEPL